MKHVWALAIGLAFGVVLTKAEIISWFRIQNMFYFREWHMYLIIAAAIGVGVISLRLVKKFGKTNYEIPDKPYTKGFLIGGFLFGMGWFITGACPGPIYAQMGAGAYPAFFSFLGALTGAYLYARFQDKLPH